MIPETWKLNLICENGAWTGLASKREGACEIYVNTYTEPRSTFEDCVALLEEKIKL